MKQSEVLELVMEMNNTIYDELIGMSTTNPIYPEFMPNITFETSGNYDMISLNGVHLWDSENYDHYCDLDEIEFKNNLIDSIHNIIDTLNKINFQR